MRLSAHYSQEIKRKSLHLSSLWIPFLYYFLEKDSMVTVLFIVTIMVVILDIGRHFSWYFGNLFYTIFARLLRPHEMETGHVQLTGASYLVASSLLVVVLFSKVIALTALMVLMVSDSMAALIGKRYGKTPLAGKTLQGTAAFVISGWLVVILCGQLFPVNSTYYAVAGLAVCISAMVELYSNKLPIDDNFSIPLSVAGIMWLGVQLLG